MEQFIMPGILLVLIIVIFIFSARSNKKKQKEAQEMMDKFQKGCEVLTIGGIMGKVVAINDKDNSFVLETGSSKNKCQIKFSKQAIYQVTEAKNAEKYDDNSEYPEEVAEETTATAETNETNE